MKSITVLIPTYVLPAKHHIRTSMMNNILIALRKKINTQALWVVFQPDRFVSEHGKDESLIDIHDFPDAIKMLQKLKPDCVLITSTHDSIQLAMSIAAKSLKIPLISIYIMNYEYFGLVDNNPLLDNITIATRKFFSDQTSTDAMENKRFFRRGKFILYKYRFLLNTKKVSGANYFDALFFTLREIFDLLRGNSKNYSDFADYHLLPNSSWIEPLNKTGIEKEKLIVTGNPYWDTLFAKITTAKNKQVNDKINILIVTDALFEHGYWSAEDRKLFLENLFTMLHKSNKIRFAIKIHPSSEDKQYYELLLQQMGIQSSIFQVERIYDLVDQFDMAISYGSTTAHTELIALGMKMIILDANVKIEPAPLVYEGIKSNLVQNLRNTNDLLSVIEHFHNTVVTLSDEFIIQRNNFFKLQNNASDNVANMIIHAIQNNDPHA